MPTLKRQFVHDDVTQGTKVTLYHHNDYDDTIASINTNNAEVYIDYNTMFFQDLFELLEETELLESYEIINNEEDETHYQQTMTIFGCKFCVWLNNNIFAMIKDHIEMSTTSSLDAYHNAWVSYGTTIPLEDYTITVNYNTTFIDVTVNYGNAEVIPLFTLMKCHSTDNTYNFVYASKNCNGIGWCANSNHREYGESPAVPWIAGYYNGTSGNEQPYQMYTSIQTLSFYYHHIYYCDEHKIQAVLINKITNTNDNNGVLIRHTTPTGNALTTSQHLFLRYKTSDVFNITFSGIKVMKPIACYFNIVFDDINEILLGPQNIQTLCPGRYYDINDEQYYVPGCDEITRSIRNASEGAYNINSLRFFFKL